MPKKQPTTPTERIENCIYLIRGQKVMLDSDLAELYDVPTKRLNEQVRRNKDRFPGDFMFELTVQELSRLRSQIATSRLGHGGRRHLPLVFTEHGALMLAGVLNSARAIQTSIYVVRAFTRLRQLLATHTDLARKLDELERKCDAQVSCRIRCYPPAHDSAAAHAPPDWLRPREEQQKMRVALKGIATPRPAINGGVRVFPTRLAMTNCYLAAMVRLIGRSRTASARHN